MNVLSLFDGMSCGQIALNRAGIHYDNYFASEIKNHAIKVTQHNYPNTIQIGDVTKVSYTNGILFTENGNFDVGQIDLLLAGSPCQDFSALIYACPREIDKNNYGLMGVKSGLFFEFLRLKKECNPKFFLLENVKMKEKSELQVNKFLGMNGVHINSLLLSAQQRYRIYWTNILNISAKPKPKQIILNDILETDENILKKYKSNPTKFRKKIFNDGTMTIVNPNKKANCLLCRANVRDSNHLLYDGFVRQLTPIEFERLQTVPENYTKILTDPQRYDVLGDGWTIDVIVYILERMVKKDNYIIESQDSLLDIL